MSTREIASPIQGGAIDAAYNLSNTLLAVQQAGQILVLARQRPQIEFSPLASLPLEESDKEITCLAWAPPTRALSWLRARPTAPSCFGRVGRRRGRLPAPRPPPGRSPSGFRRAVAA